MESDDNCWGVVLGCRSVCIFRWINLKFRTIACLPTALSTHAILDKNHAMLDKTHANRKRNDHIKALSPFAISACFCPIVMSTGNGLSGRGGPSADYIARKGRQARENGGALSGKGPRGLRAGDRGCLHDLWRGLSTINRVRRRGL